MAATVCICEGCGIEFVAARRHARWHSDACRIAKSRRDDVIPAHEPRVVEQTQAKELSPWEAVLWMLVRPDDQWTLDERGLVYLVVAA